MKLTDSQRKAIEHDDGNLQLIACAGSGKTEVVARRVVYLLSLGKGGGLAQAWTRVEKGSAPNFSELRKLEANAFSDDPRGWVPACKRLWR